MKAGQVIKVKVLETDVKRQRIALTMHLDDDFAQASAGGAGAGGSQRGGQQDRRSSGCPRQRREPEPAGVMAAAFAKLKR